MQLLSEKYLQKNYLTRAFRQYTAANFPHQKAELNALMLKKLQELFNENADADPKKMYHLKEQILPAIAIYETLQTTLAKESARETVHDFVAEHAHKSRLMIQKLLIIPGLYRIVPAVFAIFTHKSFNEQAGFLANEYQTTGGVWRIDMTRCPYHDMCVQYNCPELCSCFCDSDDIAYENLHPKIIWRRTDTLGRGGKCCDFCLKLAKAKEVSHE